MNKANIEQPPRLLIVGCGYVGKRVAKLARASGYEVFALTRSDERISELESEGCRPIVGSWHSPESLAGLPEFDAILVAIPHREEADLGELTHVRGLENLSAAVGDSQPRIVYLSTTGVFGECSGEKLNEDSPATPTRLGPKIALAAEQHLTSTLAGRATIIRLAGIYGPDRVPLAAKLRAGEPLSVPLEGYLNLVHVDDIARVTLQVIETKMRSDLYLLSDGQPVLRRDFYMHLAKLCRTSQPTFCQPSADSPKARRATSKCIDPSRIVSEIDYSFLFPSYREGLENALDASSAEA
ncbi:MAG: sugar nucleotide-binding protein [Pirellulaceae bacterium]